MKIVRVIPIAKGAPKGELSYFSKEAIGSGSIVSISIRKKGYKALVTSCGDAVLDRNLIRSSDFALKKISSVLRTEFFSSDFVEASKEVSLYYVSNIGAVLGLFTPSVILKNLNKINPSVGQSIKGNKKARKYILDGDKQKRISTYKTLIRDRFAKGESIFFVFPTVADTDYFYNALKKGIESYCFCFHSHKTARKIVDGWNQSLAEKHPVVLCATAKFLSLPRSDLGAIIVESENSSFYKIQFRPYPDVRKFVEAYATKIGADLLLADQVPSTENFERTQKGELLEFEPIESRININVETLIVDMRKKEDGGDRGFSVLSPALLGLIERTRRNSGQIILYCTKKGVASQTLCNDCGDSVRCDKCAVPLILKTIDRVNVFSCPRCGKKTVSQVRCARCNSWKLTPIGIGTDRVVAELRERFEKIKIFKLDADSIKSSGEATKICNEFLETAGSVLVGTDMIFQFLHEPVLNSAIVSLDSLFSIPDYKINERIFANILKTRNLSKERFIAQTRNPENKIMKLAIEGRISEFLQSELDDRKKYSYPPFGLFIKIGSTENDSEARIFFEKLSKALGLDISWFQSTSDTLGGKPIYYGLLKLNIGEWPNQKIRSILETLPMHIKIEVEPTSLL